MLCCVRTWPRFRRGRPDGAASSAACTCARATPVRVREGDATGYGIMERIISGVWPDLGLGVESDHRVSYT